MRIYKTYLLSFCLILVIISSSRAGGVSIPSFSITTSPDYNQFISQTTGWTGADGSYSVYINSTTTLWLYSDTWIGDIINGKHSNATIINNSIALQQGKDPQSASIHFYWQKNKEGKPIAFFIPVDSTGWFWLGSGIITNNKLYIFLSQIAKTDGDPNSIWNFKGIGTWLAEINNPNQNPLKWNVKQYKIPFGKYDANSSFFFGASIIQNGDYLYIYGCKDNPDLAFTGRNMIIARVPNKSLTNFSSWEFYSNGKWVKDVNKSTNLFNGMAPEYSVDYLPSLKKYITIYTENGMSNHIQMRASNTPYGPWSSATTIYTCPEYTYSSVYFCYAAKAHPALSLSSTDLLITYVCNSFDFWQMADDSKIYFPKFLRITFTK